MKFPTLSTLVIALALLLSLSAAAQDKDQDKNTWQIDPKHTAAQFSVRHLGISTVRGEFSKVSGTVQYDSANLARTSIQATIDVASINTRVEARDNDLRSPHFFDIGKYSTITFQSKKVEAAGAGKLKVTGDLTMHGVTKEVVLDVDGPAVAPKDQQGTERMGASATTKVNRQDYGINGAPGVAGDEITITLDIELIKK